MKPSVRMILLRHFATWLIYGQVEFLQNFLSEDSIVSVDEVKYNFILCLVYIMTTTWQIERRKNKIIRMQISNFYFSLLILDLYFLRPVQKQLVGPPSKLGNTSHFA